MTGDNPATNQFVRGDVGSMYCGECFAKVVEAAETRLSETTRLAVEALERVADIAKRNLGHQTEKLYDIEPVARTALDRLTNIMGESDG